MSKLKFWVDSIEDMPDKVKKANRRRKIWFAVINIWAIGCLIEDTIRGMTENLMISIIGTIFVAGFIYIQPHMMVWYKKCLILFFVISIFAIIPLFYVFLLSCVIGGFSLIADLILFITGKPLLYKAEVADILDKLSEQNNA